MRLLVTDAAAQPPRQATAWLIMTLGRRMNPKKYKLTSEEIRPLALNHGACIASDHIPVDGKQVGFMYREEPNNSVDSGWRFFSGEESQEYVDDPDHLAYYDTNTIANYDPAIIPFLKASIGSAFGRIPGTADFRQEKHTPEE